MKNFFIEVLKKIPFINSKNYSFGALESPLDIRDISASSFIPEAVLPKEFDLENVGNVVDQGIKSKCTFSSTKLSGDKIFKENGIDVDLSDDDGYEQAKKIDGIPNVSGTYPSVMAKIWVNNGVCTSKTYKNGTEQEKKIERQNYRLKGYAFVQPQFYAICNALYSNKIVHASLVIDTKWFYGKIMKPPQTIWQALLLILFICAIILPHSMDCWIK